MRRRLAFGILLLAVLSLAVTTSAGKPPAVKEIPVTVTVAGAGYAIQSDGGGAYINGTDGVRAVLVPLGNLVLDLRNTLPERELFLDFTGACSGPCSPPDSTVKTKAFLSTSACDNAGGLRDMTIPSSQSCNLNINFGTPGTGWLIRFGEYAWTTPASVARLADGTWTIDVAENGVAKLLSYPTKGRMVLTERGDFVMPVHLTVTLLP